MTGDRPVVSVVVPVRDDARLPGCLAALRAQTWPAALLDVVVVDDGSRRSPGPLPAARLLTQPPAGSYAARNAGVRAARGQVLAFTDADCLPAPTWVEAAVAALSAGTDVVAGHVEVFAAHPDRPRPVEAYEVVHAFPQEAYARRGCCTTANLVTTRALFERVGAFEASLQSGGDIEWTRRATASGAVLAYVPDAVVRHPARRTVREAYAKSVRVQSGVHARAVLSGQGEPPPWPGLAQLRPPLGAVRRSRSAALRTPTARAAYVVGEVLCRGADVGAAVALARRARRR